MSIQVITSFPTDGKVCIALDEKHIEMLVEGNAKANLRAVAAAAAAIIFDTAPKVAADEDAMEKINDSFNGDEHLTDEDKVCLSMTKSFHDMLATELAKKKIQQGLSEIIPDALKDIASAAILSGIEKYMESEDSEDEDNE